MSIVYLIPAKWQCAGDDCNAEVMVTAEATREGRKNRLTVLSDPPLPEGWTWDYGSVCPRCAAKQFLDRRPHIIGLAESLGVAINTPPDPRVVASVARSNEVVCQTRAGYGIQDDPPSGSGVPPGCCGGSCVSCTH